MTDHLAPHKTLAERLAAKGFLATLEYPGYVQVVLEPTVIVDIGTANVDWGLDAHDGDGRSFGGCKIAEANVDPDELFEDVVEILTLRSW